MILAFGNGGNWFVYDLTPIVLIDEGTIRYVIVIIDYFLFYNNVACICYLSII